MPFKYRLLMWLAFAIGPSWAFAQGPVQGSGAADAPPGSEAGSRSSKMGIPTGTSAGASNGVGTEGSLDHDAGKSSSTVSGMHGGTASFGRGAQPTKPAENEPAIGGGDQKPK